MIMRIPPTPTKNCRQGELPHKANSRFTETILRQVRSISLQFVLLHNRINATARPVVIEL